MAALVTLEEVKTGLRIDSSDGDSRLQLLIGAASEAVINYLKDQAEELFDLEAAENNSPADADVPDYVKQATICQVDFLDRGDVDKWDPLHPLCPTAMALLYGKRTPTIA